jgi:hypothetical protein
MGSNPVLTTKIKVMTLTAEEQAVVYTALITRTHHVEKLVNGWKSLTRTELEESLIETYSEELAKLNEIMKKIVSNA